MSVIDALTISIYRQRTSNVVGRMRLTAMVRRIDARRERFVRVNDGGSEPIRNRESHVFSHVFSCKCHRRVDSESPLGRRYVVRERRSLAQESRLEATVDGIAIAGDAWMLSKGSWFHQFLTPVFMFLSLYVSLPSEFENITS